MEMRVVSDDFPRIRKTHRAAVEAATAKATFDLHGAIVARWPVDTGLSKNAWAADLDQGVRGVFSGIVWNPVEYVPYITFGTRFMAARPIVQQTFDAVSKALLAAYARIGQGLR